MIIAMFKDIALWALVSLVFTLAFSVAFLATSDAPGGSTEVIELGLGLGLGLRLGLGLGLARHV